MRIQGTVATLTSDKSSGNRILNGDEKFYDKIESLIGIDYRKKKPGPKISEN